MRLRRSCRKYIFSLLAIAAFLVTLLSGSCFAEEQSSDYNPQNIDVVYAIDGSGSMLHSDPEKLALTAGKLFTDLCGTSDRDTRAGFVFYSQRIEQSSELESLQSSGVKDSLQSALTALSYDSKNDTDIALGLTEAVRILKDGGSFDGTRNPMILLLSDGKTDLPNGPRTVEESQKEMTSTIEEAKQLGLPIYTVGLNYNGSVDVATMKGIADATGAKYYETKSATELNAIVRDIYNDHTEGVMDNLDPNYDSATGRYSTDFTVEDESIYTVNIVILTSYGVSDPVLTNPAGQEVPIDQTDKISVTSDDTYMTIKILYPDKGKWKLSVAGDANDAIDISMLSTRDLNLQLQFDTDQVKVKQPVQAAAILRRMDEQIQDPDLLNGAKVTLTLLDEQGNPASSGTEMTYDEESHSYTCEVQPDAPGNYSAKASFTSANEKIKLESNQVSCTVSTVPLALKDGDSAQTDVELGPFEKSRKLQISDYFTYDDTAALTCSISSDGSGQAEYDEDAGALVLSRGKSGGYDVTAEVSDQYGSSAEWKIHVTQQSALIPIAAACAAIIALIVILLLVRRAKRPKLSMPVTIELDLADQFADQTPASAALTMPSGKTQIGLMDLIAENPMCAQSYTKVMSASGLDSLAGRIVLKAAGEGRVDVVIRKKPGVKLFLDHMEDGSAKDAVRSLGKGDSVSIREGEDISSSSIRLSTSGGDDAGGVFGGSTGWSGSEVFGQGGGYGFDSQFGGSGSGPLFGGGAGSTSGDGGPGPSPGNGGSGSSFGSGSSGSAFGGGGPDAPSGGDSIFGNFEGTGNEEKSPFGGSSDDGNQSGPDNPFGNFL